MTKAKPIKILGRGTWRDLVVTTGWALAYRDAGGKRQFLRPSSAFRCGWVYRTKARALEGIQERQFGEAVEIGELFPVRLYRKVRLK